MTWRGYLIFSALLGFTIGKLFAGTALVTTLPLFCLVFGGASMLVWFAQERAG